jgi:hypothetical protein
MAKKVRKATAAKEMGYSRKDMRMAKKYAPQNQKVKRK